MEVYGGNIRICGVSRCMPAPYTTQTNSGGTSGEYLPPGVPVPLHHSDYPVRRTGISGSSSLLQWISVVWAVQHILFIFFLLVF